MEPPATVGLVDSEDGRNHSECLRVHGGDRRPVTARGKGSLLFWLRFTSSLF